MTGLLLVTHEGLGDLLLAVAEGMLGGLSRPTETLPVGRGDDPEERCRSGRQALARLDDGDGVLVLTDLAGATPSNLAREIARSGPGYVVAGLNLAMLIRVYNYPNLNREALASSALEAGRTAVVDWSPSIR